MTISLINGSPKKNNSISEVVLNLIKKMLPEDEHITDHTLRKPETDANTIESISKSNVIIFAFPLYVDGIPSHLLYWLSEIEQHLTTNPNHDIQVYGIVNCGFFEGRQGAIALEILENWCIKAGLKWGQGLSIGGGGMLSMLRNGPNGAGPWGNLIEALKTFVSNITDNKQDDNIFVQPNIPRIAYKIGGDAGWRKQVKVNGLTTKDLHRKIN